MNVASLENSKRLYELSGWGDQTWWHVYERDINGYRTGEKTTETVAAIEYFDVENHKIVPAYDAGYLLKKLQENGIFPILELRLYSKWWAKYGRKRGSMLTKPEALFATADTPENALAELAIELFEAGVLERGSK